MSSMQVAQCSSDEPSLEDPPAPVGYFGGDFGLAPNLAGGGRFAASCAGGVLGAAVLVPGAP